MAIKKGDKKDKSDKKKGGKREKTPWKAKQLMRLQRVSKGLSKLNKVLKAARPPGIDLDAVELADTKIGVVMGKVATLPDDWKPARGSTPGSAKKVGAGSVVSVRDDLDAEASKMYGDQLPAKEIFAKSTVTSEYDNRNWFVKCQDGMTRILKKKHAALVE